MKTLRMISLMTLAMVALAAVSLADVTNEPGYYDMEWITIPDGADEIQDVDLSYMLADVAAQAREDGDNELAQVLAMVRSVRVKAFSVEPNDTATEAAVERMTSDLRKQGWNRLIYVKDGDETVSVSSMHQDGMMVGLAVVVYEPGDSAAFINVVGDLDLATLMGLAGEFDLDDIDEMMEEYGDHGHGHDHDDEKRVH